ncbi:MAG: Asp-tRNA(Asn)/Glu-tRNA(Gln) amidotransferase subunit GatC [Candidatus Paceibacterota bacterium]
MEITKEQLENLANLSKLEIEPEKEAALTEDFNKILSHFEELKELEDRSQSQLSAERQELRKDSDIIHPEFVGQEAVKEQFPEKQGTSLVVPHVFKKEE